MKQWLNWLNRLLLLFLGGVEWFNLAALEKDASVMETVVLGNPKQMAEVHNWTLQLAQDFRITKYAMAFMALALVIGIYVESEQEAGE